MRANPGVIDGGANRPLHMMPSGGKKGWSIQFDELPKLILRLTLSDGTVGWGEFYRDHSWPVIEGIVEALLDQPIDSFPLSDLPIPNCREHDGFECAIWDAYARWLDIPLHRLLGGQVRARVKVGAWSSHRPTGEMGPVAASYRAQGYDCIKLKCDLEDDVVAWAREIAELAPGMKIILDPNQRWENSGNARRLIRELEAVGNILLLEDPIRRWMVDEYAELRRFTSIPIVLHVSPPYGYQGQRPYEAIDPIIHGAVDGFNFGGGLGRFQELSAIAKVANLPVWHGSEIDLGILEAMYLHQACAAPACTWPSDIFGRMIRSDDLLAEPIRFEPPFAFVPDGPGLGITVSEAALERYGVKRRQFGGTK